MLPFKEVYGLAAPLRWISGMVAMSRSYRATLSLATAFFFVTPTVAPQSLNQQVENVRRRISLRRLALLPPSRQTFGLSFDRHGHGVATTEAKRRDATMNIAANHFINERNQHTRSASPDWVSDGNGTTVHVDFVGIEPKFAHHTERLHGERFVQFIQIHVFILPASLLPNCANCTHRSHHHPFRFDSAGSLCHDPGHRFGA